MVIDADGLNAHAGRLKKLRDRSEPTVLTPHEGELGRLLELDGAYQPGRLRGPLYPGRDPLHAAVLVGEGKRPDA